MPDPTNQIDLDDTLHAFLETVRGGQCLELAAWAARLLKRGTLTIQELERCFSLGFEG